MNTKRTRKSMALAFAAVAAAAGAAAAQTAPGPANAPAAAPAKVNLVVNANGFKGNKGQAVFALYASGDTWLKVDKAYRKVLATIDGNTVTATFADLPPGVYAVSVIHDENRNGKLDMRWFPFPAPTEGAGVSNDATATLGPPSFDASRFRLTEKGGVIGLKVRY